MLWMLPLAVASGNGQVESICWERFSCEILFQPYLETWRLLWISLQANLQHDIGPPAAQRLAMFHLVEHGQSAQLD